MPPKKQRKKKKRKQPAQQSMPEPSIENASLAIESQPADIHPLIKERQSLACLKTLEIHYPDGRATTQRVTERNYLQKARRAMRYFQMLSAMLMPPANSAYEAYPVTHPAVQRCFDWAIVTNEAMVSYLEQQAANSQQNPDPNGATGLWGFLTEKLYLLIWQAQRANEFSIDAARQKNYATAYQQAKKAIEFVQITFSVLKENQQKGFNILTLVDSIKIVTLFHVACTSAEFLARETNEVGFNRPALDYTEEIGAWHAFIKRLDIPKTHVGPRWNLQYTLGDMYAKLDRVEKALGCFNAACQTIEEFGVCPDVEHFWFGARIRYLSQWWLQINILQFSPMTAAKLKKREIMSGLKALQDMHVFISQTLQRKEKTFELIRVGGYERAIYLPLIRILVNIINFIYTFYLQCGKLDALEFAEQIAYLEKAIALLDMQIEIYAGLLARDIGPLLPTFIDDKPLNIQLLLSDCNAQKNNLVTEIKSLNSKIEQQKTQSEAQERERQQQIEAQQARANAFYGEIIEEYERKQEEAAKKLLKAQQDRINAFKKLISANNRAVGGQDGSVHDEDASAGADDAAKIKAPPLNAESQLLIEARQRFKELIGRCNETEFIEKIEVAKNAFKAAMNKARAENNNFIYTFALCGLGDCHVVHASKHFVKRQYHDLFKQLDDAARAFRTAKTFTQQLEKQSLNTHSQTAFASECADAALAIDLSLEYVMAMTTQTHARVTIRLAQLEEGRKKAKAGYEKRGRTWHANKPEEALSPLAKERKELDELAKNLNEKKSLFREMQSTMMQPQGLSSQLQLGLGSKKDASSSLLSEDIAVQRLLKNSL